MKAREYEIMLCKDGNLYINKAEGNDFRSNDSKAFTEEDYNQVKQWLTKNLWHNAKESHNKNKKLIIKLIDGRYIFWQGSFDNIENHLHLYEAVGLNETPRGIVVQWCYIDDLLPMTLQDVK